MSNFDRWSSWKPKVFHHPKEEMVGMQVPMEDVKRADFMTWSSQASLTYFIQKCMKDSVEAVKETN